MCLLIHIGRGLYINSFILFYPWLRGRLIFLILIGVAFLGYVLPWGQISFWGATVITNLLSAIPFFGNEIVVWLWGGFRVGGATLRRFYRLHFILPFLILAIVLFHLFRLHLTGSRNPLGVVGDLNKIPFHNYYLIKDRLVLIFILVFLLILVFLFPYLLGDPENFNVANSIVTPIHIQPEWYFLFAYAILRSIPNKLGGVIALFISVGILIVLPFFTIIKFQSLAIYPLNQFLYWMFINVFILLTWIGIKPIEFPFVGIGQVLTVLYFIYFLINFFFLKYWEGVIE